jgi:hypothetical protein
MEHELIKIEDDQRGWKLFIPKDSNYPLEYLLREVPAYIREHPQTNSHLRAGLRVGPYHFWAHDSGMITWHPRYTVGAHYDFDDQVLLSCIKDLYRAK